MYTIYISLGSNLGNRAGHIANALKILSESDLLVNDLSSLYVSKAWGFHDQPDFYNQVVRMQTDKPADQIMEIMLKTEKDLGRVKSGKWQHRNIDLDLLFFGNEVIKTEDLIVPHPMIQERNFILTPMMDLDPDLVHPVLGKTIRELYLDSEDHLEVLMIELNG